MIAYTTEFCSLIIQNAYSFKGRYKINLKNQGLIPIFGRNLDAKVNGDATEDLPAGAVPDISSDGFVSSNGAGKTTILKCFLRVWFGTKKVCEKETIAEGMYGGKTGKDFLLYGSSRRNGHLYEVLETRKNSDYATDGAQFFIDKKRVGLKNSEESFRPQFVRQAIGLTYEEFISTVVITQNASHVLINGSPQACTDFISKMFGLGRYDDLYDIFKPRYDKTIEALQELAPIQAEHETYAAQLAELPPISDLKLSLDDVDHRVRKLRAEKLALQQERDSVCNKISDAENQQSTLNDLARIRAKYPDIDFSQVTHALDAIVARREKLNGKLARAKDMSASLKGMASTFHKLNSARKTLKDLDLVHVNTQDLRKLQSKITQDERLKTQKLERDHALTRAREKGQAIQLQIKQAGIVVVPYKKAKAEFEKLAELESDEQEIIDTCVTLLNIREEYDTALVHCPTCGTKVTAESISREIEKTKAIMFRHEELRKGYHTEAQKYLLSVDLAEFMQDYPDIDLSISDNDLLRAAKEIQAQRDKLACISDALDACAIIDQCQAVIKSSRTDIAEEELQSVINKLEVALKNLSGEYNDVSLYVNLKQSVKHVVKPSRIGVLRSNLHLINADLKDCEKDLEVQLAATERLESQLDTIRNLRRHERKSAERLQGLAKLERDERVLKELCRAYGKNGLKLEKVSNIIKSIRDRLPKWLRLTITESNFRIDVKDDPTALKLQCVKTIRKKASNGTVKTEELTYSVRNASGGEQTRIMFALLMTLLEIVPVDKRTNITVLDELERGLDPVNRYLLSEFFITELRKAKPTVIVISHSLNIPLEVRDGAIQVTRKNNTATLVQGA